jgi:hypothetical protein
MNKIFLEKRSKVILPTGGSDGQSKFFAATVAKNWESLGYAPSRKLFVRLASLPVEEIEKFYKEVTPVLKQMRGGYKAFKPFYPNFPKQVIEASDAELYFNALVHYWSFVLKDAGVIENTWLPHYEKEERPALDEKHALDVIDLGTQAEFDGICTTLLSAKSSISESDKAVVTWFAETYKDKVLELVPEKVPMKEQMALIVGLVLKHTNSADKLSKLVKTPTDVLRIATALAGGDVSLAENTKFKKFSRSVRRFLLGLLENNAVFAEKPQTRTSGVVVREEFVKYASKWLRLGEVLHPGEYKHQYPNCFTAFTALRAGQKIPTFNGKVEGALKKLDASKAVDLLKNRPGDFARRLDHVVRTQGLATGSGDAAREFLEVADKVSTPVLLQVYNHFRHRNELDFRPVFPKGTLAKMQVLENKRLEIPDDFCKPFAEVVRNRLVARFSQMDKLGTVYLDENLKDFLVPFSQRSAAKALKTIVRGSKLNLDGDYDTIRFFIWWKNGTDRTDLDLSAVILDENWNYLTDISYYNLKNFGGHHSGDITDAPKGAAEFIDISLSNVVKGCEARSANSVLRARNVWDYDYGSPAIAGGRYIVMCVNSYTTQPLCDLPECFAGWMGRQRPDSGEVFEAKTVKNKIDLASNTTCSIPLVIDCKERKVIWCDIALKSRPTFNNVYNNKKNIALVCKAMATMNKVDLHDLFSMHVQGRGGKLVDKREEADTIFSVEEGVTPFDVDKIMAEYL